MRLTGAIATRLVLRWHELTDVKQRERGESPIPTVIIITGLALLAAVVVTWAIARANAYMDQAPAGVPGGEGGG